MKKSKSVWIMAAVLVIALGIVSIVLLNRDNDNVDSDVNNNQSGDTDRHDSQNKEGYYFEYNGIQIGINDEAAPILEKFGEPMTYFEAPSCAFEGMDKIYSYSGFEFVTYTKDDKDYISSVVFLDDMVTTREGIGLNASLEEVISVYGKDYEKSFEQYSYSDGNCVLSFLLENDEVVSVEYAMPAENGE